MAHPALQADALGAPESPSRRQVAYFTHHERRNRRMVNTETADGERPAMVTVIGWTFVDA
jgi:hypothetical protein